MEKIHVILVSLIRLVCLMGNNFVVEDSFQEVKFNNFGFSPSRPGARY